jgi:aminocarboxymuconate-semialdehyde decarboxylase
VTGRRGALATIDVHSHLLIPETGALLAEHGAAGAGRGGPVPDELRRRLTDVGARLQDMDAMGVDVQLLSVTPRQFHYGTDPELGAEIARRHNDRIADVVADHPDRFVGLGTLPMQDVGRAVAELERIAADHRFPGVAVNTNVEGRDYDHPDFAPFWAKVLELDVVVLLHPSGFAHGTRTADYYLENVVGNPVEMALALSRLVLGGVLDRHPGVKVCAVHGGGFLPFYPERMDHAYDVRPECRTAVGRAPSSYLEDLYFDSVVFGNSLPRLIQAVGHDRVVMGSDYPYDMGQDDPVGRIQALVGRRAAQALLHDNAARLFGLT